MSGLLDQAGLTAGSGLTNGAGLYKWGNFNPFDPTDLDPYLLFDTGAGSMIGTLENPTLDLDPSNQETLDVITATRSSVATRTLPDGTIALAEQDTVRVDYTQGAELTPTKFQHIENTDFSSWSHARTSDTANAAISPDGQNNATYVEQNVGETSAGSIYRFDAAFTGVFTFSVYAKKKEKNFVVLYDSNVGRTYFNLETGTVGTVASGNTANIEDAGNGWFRCSVTFTASSGTVKAFYVGDTDNSLVVTGGGGIYIYGPQLEEGTTASSFVANTTGSPKFLSSAVYSDRVPMILVEPSATNLVTYSEDFSQGSWNKNRVTVVDNSVTSPDGSLNAVKLVETATTATHLTWTQATTTAATHSFSVFAKSGERKRIGLRDNQIGNSAVFDLESGSVISGSGGSIAQAANGFFRITLTGTYAAAGTRHEIYVLPDNATTTNTSYTGDGTSGLYIWGAQLEAGSVSTSYIPTSGGDAAARTRAADDLVISGSDFSDFYNQSEGTFYVEFVPSGVTDNHNIFQFEQSAGNRIVGSIAGGPLLLQSEVSSVDEATLNLGSIAVNQLSRLAGSFKLNNFKASVNGGSELADTSVAIPSSMVLLNIGQRSSNNRTLNGQIKRLLFWPTHSSRL